MPWLIVLLLVLLLFGGGFVLEALWWVAVIALVVWALGFVLRSTNASGSRGTWYRW
ncbi:hypothetical protein GCM10027160_34880 [Streptomyces calidiresistens]|uniref:Hydrophobic protein n=1 Tax=Streptomyces calidiresistens TaxID=1485586 RepID=A0A7W3XVD7_9ACTN|nr:hydrophobic protein [Streptomyces calidiresistens]MBB0228860.1 hydrophobic protein [Streptomyces calidiresistens]